MLDISIHCDNYYYGIQSSYIGIYRFFVLNGQWLHLCFIKKIKSKQTKNKNFEIMSHALEIEYFPIY